LDLGLERGELRLELSLLLEVKLILKVKEIKRKSKFRKAQACSVAQVWPTAVRASMFSCETLWVTSLRPWTCPLSI
jgi:hypothetical protein